MTPMKAGLRQMITSLVGNLPVHLGGSLYLEKGFNVLEVGRKLNWGKCLFSVEKWMMAASS